MRRNGLSLVTTMALLTLTGVPGASAQADRGIDCDQTSVGLTPLDQFETDQTYAGFTGGLYPNGINVIPRTHALALREASHRELPAQYVLMSAGMSNAHQEWHGKSPNIEPDSFMALTLNDDRPRDGLILVDGAQGGRDANKWGQGGRAWNPADGVPALLTAAGVSPNDVLFVWAKHALSGQAGLEALPHPDADAFELITAMGEFVREAKRQLPNLRIVYCSSRMYAGYATGDMNPEPIAYETGFSVKLLIEAQINQRATGVVDLRAGDLRYWGDNPPAPLLAWGPYTWRDGLPFWECDDFNQDDGTHPAAGPNGAQRKWAEALLAYFTSSPYTRPWFDSTWTPQPPDDDGGDAGGAGCEGDLDGDGDVDGDDLAILLGNWGACDDELVALKLYHQHYEPAVTEAAATALERAGIHRMPLAFRQHWGKDGSDIYDPQRWAERFPDLIVDGMTAIMLDVEGQYWELLDPGIAFEVRRQWADMMIQLSDDTRALLDARNLHHVEIVAYNQPKTSGWDKTDAESLQLFADVLRHVDASAPVLYPSTENESMFGRRARWADEHFEILDAIGMRDQVKTYFLIGRGWKTAHDVEPIPTALLSDEGYERLIEIALDERADGVVVFGQYGHPNRDFSDALPDGCTAECAIIRDSMILAAAAAK